MNPAEHIAYMARANAGRAAPLPEPRADLPYLRVSRDAATGRLVASGGQHEGHPNESRMAAVTAYFNERVLHLVEPGACVEGFYPIELHDSHTYLRNGKDYGGVLSFATAKAGDRAVLIPDIYGMYGYGATMAAAGADARRASAKPPRACFFGATTGATDPDRNERIRACIWSLEGGDARRAKFDFNISKVVQMDAAAVGRRWPQLQQATRTASIADQVSQYRYHLMMDGNTARFDMWSLSAGCVVLKYDGPDMLWWHAAMQAGTHYMGLNLRNAEAVVQYLDANPAEADRISADANVLARSYCSPLAHALYAKALLEEMGGNAA